MGIETEQKGRIMAGQNHKAEKGGLLTAKGRERREREKGNGFKEQGNEVFENNWTGGKLQVQLSATVRNYSQLLANGGKGRPCERRKSKVERRSSSVTSTMEDGKSRQRLRAWNGADYRGMPRKRNYRRKRRNEVLTTRCSNQ
jgi:hypothetical protein